jgi:glycerol-3-phosphate cytidylyltransferase-like family protein
MPKVIVTGSFDDLRSRHVRFLEEASRLGSVTVLLWSDAAAEALEGTPPKFPLQ